MAEISSNPEQRTQERMELRDRGEILLSLAKATLGETALVRNREFDRTDIAAARTFYREAAPYAHPRVYFWDHSLLASIYAKHLARATGLVSEETAETLGLLHDNSVLAVPHRYLRKEYASKFAQRAIGVRPEITAMLPPIPEIIGIQKTKQPPVEIVTHAGGQRTIGGMSRVQQLFDLADNLSRLDVDGHVRSIDGVRDYLDKFTLAYAEPLWPTERRGLTALAEGKQAFNTELFTTELEQFTSDLQIDFRKIREDVETEYYLPENQAWLREVKDRQETLDRAVDEKLARPPVRTVVFDIGNVLIDGPDPGVCDRISRKTGLSRARVEELFSEDLPANFRGEISDETFFGRFVAEAVEPVTTDDIREIIDTIPEGPVPGMPDLISELQRNGMELGVLSDLSPSYNTVITRFLKTHYPMIPESRWFFSNALGTCKRDAGSPAIAELVRRLDPDNRESVLFVDDIERYTREGRSIHGIRTFTFRSNPEREESAADRLRRELQSGRYL